METGLGVDQEVNGVEGLSEKEKEVFGIGNGKTDLTLENGLDHRTENGDCN